MSFESKDHNKVPSGGVPNPSRRGTNWTSIVWLMFLWFLIAFSFRLCHSPNVLELSYSDFKSYAKKGTVAEITLASDTVQGKFKNPVEKKTDGEKQSFQNFRTTLPPLNDPELLPLLEEQGVEIHAESKGDSWLTTALIILAPWLLIIGLIYFSGRRLQQRMSGGLFNFGKSKAKLFSKTNSETTFDDVAGLENSEHSSRTAGGLRRPPKGGLRLWESPLGTKSGVIRIPDPSDLSHAFPGRGCTFESFLHPDPLYSHNSLATRNANP